MNQSVHPDHLTARELLRTGTLLLGLSLLLGGCSTITSRDSGPAKPVDVSSVPDAVPRPEPISAKGNPSSYVVFGKRYYVMKSSLGYEARGTASWYGTKFHGRRTANGEVYNMYAMTAAHRTLPLPTYLQVTNLRNGRQVVVRVNDRGPFHSNRIIDLSYAAAKKLGIVGHGTAPVELKAIDPNRPAPPTQMARYDTQPILPATQPAPSAPNTAPRVQAATELNTPRPQATPLPPTPPVAATSTPKTSPVPKTPATAAQPLYLQVGAFSDRDNAKRLQQRLRAQGISRAIIESSSAASRPLYRVRIGPLPGPDEAQRLTRRLTTLGISKPQLVVD